MPDRTALDLVVALGEAADCTRCHIHQLQRFAGMTVSVGTTRVVLGPVPAISDLCAAATHLDEALHAIEIALTLPTTEKPNP